MDKREWAVELKRNGHNCCQAVMAAYAEELDIPMELLDRMGAAFGGGMATMEATCGSLCGARMVLGLMAFKGRPIPALARAVLRDFEAHAGATQCRVLKGIDTGVLLCACDDCVRNAVDALERLREKEGLS